MSKKYCYLFTEGNANMRELLGGKGAPVFRRHMGGDGAGFALGMERVFSALEAAGIEIPVEKGADVYCVALGEKAREKAATTMDEVKRAMRINYFDDAELIRAQSEKYEEK